MNKDKYKSCVHYIINRVQELTDGVTKGMLLRILYFSDFNFYEKHNRLITDDIYIKKVSGPISKKINIILGELINEHKIKKTNKNIKSLSIPYINISSDEKQEIDSVISNIYNMGWLESYLWIYNDAPYHVSEINESIDPELVFYRSDRTF